MAKGALRVIASKNCGAGLVELCEYPTGGLRSNDKYGVQVNEKEVDIGFMSLTTNDLSRARQVYDSYK